MTFRASLPPSSQSDQKEFRISDYSKEVFRPQSRHHPTSRIIARFHIICKNFVKRLSGLSIYLYKAKVFLLKTIGVGTMIFAIPTCTIAVCYTQRSDTGVIRNTFPNRSLIYFLGLRRITIATFFTKAIATIKISVRAYHTTSRMHSHSAPLL